VHNPYALDRNPCGSSSGSGVAVAAHLCTVAIGTETDGSIVCPSSTNGIVGIKPTVGLVSRAGIVPISHSQDTAGPMARTVADATAVLSALVGLDERDPATTASVGKFHSDYTQFLDANGLQGMRLGVARNYFGKQAKVDQLLNEAIDIMRQAGAVIVDEANIETASQISDPEFEVLLYEFKADLNAYLAERGDSVEVHSLAEIIAFNEAHRQQTMPYFEQETMHMAQEKGDLSEEAYLTARAESLRLAAEEGIDATLQKHNLDAIIGPTGSPAWITDWVNSDHYSISSSTAAAVAGYPNITVPAGYVFGLPVGISFFSTAYQEPTLIKIAYSFEHLTHFRHAPQFYDKVQFNL
jgi:amidase